MSDETRPGGIPAEQEALRADRDHLREELGQTVSELTDKLDVQAQAKKKLHGVADSARTTAADAGHKAEERAHRAAEQARQLADKVESATPEPVVERGRQAAEVARRRPVPLVAVAAVAGGLAAWWVLRGRQR
ncbi:DUF3618 domain-containing protein [Nocardia aurea]|uniref:DUF3618 domain-containing protein n=1 Tax=Nocardia aurea TaxID=2144174 RepID=A0ABV3FTF0_9NOCA